MTHRIPRSLLPRETRLSAELIPQLVIYMVVLLLAISAHEAAHAWMSNQFGDDTARFLGRITLNPVAHTDPIGTLLIPIAGFIFGHMAGPAQYSSDRLGKADTGQSTAMAEQGPGEHHGFDRRNLANLTIAIMRIADYQDLSVFGTVVRRRTLLRSLVEPVGCSFSDRLLLNVSLAVFNLLPFPPLDGSKILYTILPDSMKPAT